MCLPRTGDGGAERCVQAECKHLSPCAWLRGQQQVHSCLRSPGRSLRAWQKAHRSVKQGKGWTVGPQGGSDKGPGIKLVEEKAKGKLVIGSLQRNEFQSQWLGRQIKSKCPEVAHREIQFKQGKMILLTQVFQPLDSLKGQEAWLSALPSNCFYPVLACILHLCLTVPFDCRPSEGHLLETQFLVPG